MITSTIAGFGSAAIFTLFMVGMRLWLRRQDKVVIDENGYRICSGHSDIADTYACDVCSTRAAGNLRDGLAVINTVGSMIAGIIDAYAQNKIQRPQLPAGDNGTEFGRYLDHNTMCYVDGLIDARVRNLCINDMNPALGDDVVCRKCRDEEQASQSCSECSARGVDIKRGANPMLHNSSCSVRVKYEHEQRIARYENTVYRPVTPQQEFAENRRKTQGLNDGHPVVVGRCEECDAITVDHGRGGISEYHLSSCSRNKTVSRNDSLCTDCGQLKHAVGYGLADGCEYGRGGRLESICGSCHNRKNAAPGYGCMRTGEHVEQVLFKSASGEYVQRYLPLKRDVVVRVCTGCGDTRAASSATHCESCGGSLVPIKPSRISLTNSLGPM